MKADHRSKFSAPFAVKVFLTGALSVVAGPANAQFKSCKGGNGQEVPCLKIDIPGVILTKPSSTTKGTITTISVPFLAQYINGVYQFGLYAAVIVAGVMMIIGGFQWLTAGDSGRVSEAKERISNAVIGVVLALGAYTLLNTINPELIALKGLKIDIVAGIPITQEEKEDYETFVAVGGETESGSGDAKAVAYCKSADECREKCKDPSKWPKTNQITIDVSKTELIPDSNGLIGNGQRATSAVITALKAAGEIAMKQGYTIQVTSGFRTLERQMQIVCTDYIGKADKEPLIGKSVSYPGGSNHGAGYAVDLMLLDRANKKVIVASGDCAAQAAGNNATAEDSAKFNQIMFDAGFVRYQNEIWHFEFGSNRPCRCGGPSGKPCPAYPPKCNRACN